MSPNKRCRRNVLIVVAVTAAMSVSAGHRVRAQAAPREVSVVGSDYAFAAPDTVAAGRAVFRFVNHGLKGHELAIALVRRGTTAAQIIAAAQAGLPTPRLAEAYADGPPAGALFAAPGSQGRATLVTTLERGRTYVLVCTFRNAPTEPQHVMLGMFHLIYVQ